MILKAQSTLVENYFTGLRTVNLIRCFVAGCV